MIPKNKKAQLGEQLTVFAFLFLLVVIGIGIAGGVYIFFGSGYDSRQVEADILNHKVRNCLSENILDDNFKDNFYEICKLNKQSMEVSKNLIKICVTSGNCIEEGSPFFSTGGDFVICDVEAAKRNNAFQKCSHSTFTKEGKELQIITTSNQQIRRTIA